MGKAKELAAGVLFTLLTCTAVLCVAARLPENMGQNTAEAAVKFILPAGNADGFFSEDEVDDSVSNLSPSSAPPQVIVSSLASEAAESAGAASQSETQTNPNVVETTITTGGIQYGNLWVKNSNTNHSIDIGAELAEQPAVKIDKSAGPMVLIYHTHTTEAYYGDTRSTDKTRSVCAVGDKIEQELEADGIGVIHDTTYHDYPAYDGSYDRSRVTMKNDLAQYPTIQVTLDIHRDAMQRSDGTELKTIANINGKTAAQIMILAGCDDKGDLNFPNWEYNLRLALRLQQTLSNDYPTLARPMDFCNRRYNEDVTKGSLLIEIGTDANTLDEAEYSGELLGKALAKTLDGLT